MSIKILNLAKNIDDRLLLNDISYEFLDNNFYVIKGDNGVGKTTFLYILALLDNSYSGRILIDGNDIKRLKKKDIKALRRNNISLLFSKGNLISYLTVKENRTLFLNKNEPLILNNNINDAQNSNTLSGGEEILVALERELSLNKKTILLDEVTASLDDSNLEILMSILTKLSKTHLIILVSHDPRTYTYGTLLEMKNGKLQ